METITHESIEDFGHAYEGCGSGEGIMQMFPFIHTAAEGISFSSGGERHLLAAAEGQDPWELRDAYTAFENRPQSRIPGARA